MGERQLAFVGGRGEEEEVMDRRRRVVSRGKANEGF